LKEQIDHAVTGRSAGLLTVGLIGTIWAASHGIGSVMKATNRVWGVEETRSFGKRALIMVGLTLSAGLGLLLAFVVLFGAQVYGAKIADAIGAGAAFAVAVAILRFPVAIVLIMIAVAILYWAAPNNDQPLGWGSIGAVFFTISWLVATSLFGLYISHFGSYNKTYGAIGGVIVLLVWLNLTSTLLLLGSEINAVVRRERLARAVDGARMKGQARR
jgi:membrane protein